MNYKWNCLILGFCAVNLCSCIVSDEHYTPKYQAYTYDDNQMYVPKNYTASDAVYRNSNSSQTVTVPESYHVGEYHSPVSFKDRDRTWVSGQNPQGYTIELAEGEKAAQVAQKLYNTPKNDRMAQVKYQVNGKAYYKGVYGTYPDASSAQKALDALPDDVKSGAGIKNWGSLQQNLD